MPIWYISSVVLGAVWAVLTWGAGGVACVVAGVALLLVSVVLSLVLLVPINSRALTWSSEEPPADWMRQIRKWDRWHYVRVGVIVLAFASFASALVR